MLKLLMASFILFLPISLNAAALTCAISEDYPPYQFSKDGKPAGIDVQIIRLFNEAGGPTVKVIPLPWQEAISKLYYTNEIDCIWGMEIDNSRHKKFLFSKSMYGRKIALFTKKETEFKSLKDLNGKIIAGDKDTPLDQKIKESKDLRGVRVRYPYNRREAFKLLAADQVYGVISPLSVGNFYKKKMGAEFKLAYICEEQTPIVVAVKKGEAGKLEKINKTLNNIPISEIKAILKNWRDGRID